MKKHEIYFGIIRVPLDFFTVMGSFFIASSIRQVTDLIPSISLPIQNISDESLFYFSLYGSILFIIIASIYGSYRIKISNSKLTDILSLVSITFRWFIFYIGLVYLASGFLYEEQIPRLIILFSSILLFLGIFINRLILNFAQSFLLKKGYLKKQNLILIQNKHNKDIIEDIYKANIYNIIGYINLNKISYPKLTPISEYRGLENINYLGGKSDFIKLSRDRIVDEILFLGSDFNKKDEEDIFEISRIYGIRYRFAANLFEVSKSNAKLTLLYSLPFIEIQNIGLTPWRRFLKRLIDFVTALLLLLILFPVFLIISLIKFFEDFNNPFYSSVRIGKNGKYFKQYKFRSMIIGAESKKKDLLNKNERDKSPLFKIKDDFRVTKFGKFLRKYSIDELPQLINVLKGDMSLIGPRPHLPDEILKYKESEKRLLTIKPGISGMAQVNGRHMNSFEDEVKLDIFYIENWSIILDIKIFLKTILVVFKGTGE